MKNMKEILKKIRSIKEEKIELYTIDPDTHVYTSLGFFTSTQYNQFILCFLKDELPKKNYYVRINKGFPIPRYFEIMEYGDVDTSIFSKRFEVMRETAKLKLKKYQNRDNK